MSDSRSTLHHLNLNVGDSALSTLAADRLVLFKPREQAPAQSRIRNQSRETAFVLPHYVLGTGTGTYHLKGPRELRQIEHASDSFVIIHAQAFNLKSNS